MPSKPLEMRLTSPWSTEPGPISVKSVAPSSSIAFTLWVQRTGEVSWESRLALIRQGSVSALALTFWYTGQEGMLNDVFSMA